MPTDAATDVTNPGQEESLKEPVRLVRSVGHFPLIFHPWFNRGTSFTLEERWEKGIAGLIPTAVESMDEQADRLMAQLFEYETDDLHRHNVLKTTLIQCTELYYKVLIENIERLVPIVYTPTIGEVCQRWNRQFREPVGMYLSAFHHRGRFRDVLRNWPTHSAQIIVITDGSRVLGLGDLGTNGVAISIGKIALYVAGAGFHPEQSVPICLDVGCNRDELRKDRFYLGEPKPRLAGDEYYAVIDEFCDAVQAVFPDCLVQFEDFETSKAFRILDQHRDRMLCFNDDIQGTGAVVTAGFINGMKLQRTELRDARIVFYGAGSSAVGVANSIVMHMVQRCGLSERDAKARMYLVDSKGLVTAHRGDELAEHKRALARGADVPNLRGLRDIVAHVRPHALIGLTGAGPSWDEAVIRELCRHVDLPLVFPLSNPTSQSEISAADAYAWSDGACIFAGGSPYAPVELGGRTFVPGQANNVLVFPGIGYGALMTRSRVVSDAMLVAAAVALAATVPEAELTDTRRIYPPISALRAVSMRVAAAVGRAAWEGGHSKLEEAPRDWEQYMRDHAYWPDDSCRKKVETQL